MICDVLHESYTLLITIFCLWLFTVITFVLTVVILYWKEEKKNSLGTTCGRVNKAFISGAPSL